MPGKLVVCKRCGDTFAEGVGIRCSCKEDFKQAIKNLKRANSHLARINTHLRELLKDGSAFTQDRPNCDALSPIHHLPCSCGYSQWSSTLRATFEEI